MLEQIRDLRDGGSKQTACYNVYFVTLGGSIEPPRSECEFNQEFQLFPEIFS